MIFHLFVQICHQCEWDISINRSIKGQLILLILFKRNWLLFFHQQHLNLTLHMSWVKRQWNRAMSVANQINTIVQIIFNTQFICLTFSFAIFNIFHEFSCGNNLQSIMIYFSWLDQWQITRPSLLNSCEIGMLIKFNN